MADNTTLPPSGLGDTIRTLDKTGTGIPKTEAVALDVGGRNMELIASLPIQVLPDGITDDDRTAVGSLSVTTMDQFEILFRQLIAARKLG